MAESKIERAECQTLHLPKVSVVVGIYNGASQIERTLLSVLNQQGIDFEVIVVDDGSTDNTLSILQRLARSYDNLRVFSQEKNQGLTKALIRGCNEARGEYIARQDIGDISYPDRLRIQWSFMQSNHDVVLSATWTQLRGPLGEDLGCNCPQQTAQENRNRILSGKSGVTHHGSVMYRKDTYLIAGGYRKEFYYAQDTDLWIRIAKIGNVSFVQNILYEVGINPESISSRHRKEQIELHSISVALSQTTDEMDDEKKALLLRAEAIRPIGKKTRRRSNGVGNYWIGRTLYRRGQSSCLNYLSAAVSENPMNIKYWLALICARTYFVRDCNSKGRS
jgi:glycosyltransferase involved in cell wall biosynthesis